MEVAALLRVDKAHQLVEPNAEIHSEALPVGKNIDVAGLLPRPGHLHRVQCAHGERGRGGSGGRRSTPDAPRPKLLGSDPREGRLTTRDHCSCQFSNSTGYRQRSRAQMAKYSTHARRLPVVVIDSFRTLSAPPCALAPLCLCAQHPLHSSLAPPPTGPAKQPRGQAHAGHVRLALARAFPRGCLREEAGSWRAPSVVRVGGH
mmetsp:Transcript_17731/g.55362  ORF Transcript_17731/g.55362 Transcript_17731/m.55362 type:complete len:203 (+) Transcript_17731:2823-3431(+)